jgi:hypothetical protein
MSVPFPTPIFRIVHVDNLGTLVRRGGLHAGNHTPQDDLPYRTIHNVDMQNERHVRRIPCGPGGTLHDYVPFYFGYLSPMLLQLKTGRVAGYKEGQEPLVYLRSTAQAVEEAGCGFVFSNGHGIAAFTDWFDELSRLSEVDWGMVYQRYWSDNVNEMDRQRRKQAEFLVHRFCPWRLIDEVGVANSRAKARVEELLQAFEASQRPVVKMEPGWYY